MTTKNKLIHAVTEYDRKQSKKSSHNHYALPQYFERIDLIMEDIEAGADIRKAITAGFTGRLADCCLRSLGLPITTDDDTGPMVYIPARK